VVIGALALCAATAMVPSCARRIEDPAKIAAAVTAALRRGDLASADSSVAQGESLTKGQPQGDWALRFRFLRADVFLSQRDLTEAALIAEISLPADSPALRELRARQQYLSARIEYAQGHLAKALEVANLATADANDGSELKLEIEGFAGQLGLQLGRWPESEARLESVVSGASASKHEYVGAMALVSQGMGMFVRNRFDEALSSFERVTAVADLDGTIIYAKALHNSGMCLARLGQFDRAVEKQHRAITLLQPRSGSVDYEQALGQLGNTYVLQARTEEGLSYMQQAFSAANGAKLSADATLWAKNLAAAYVDLQDWNAAERYNEEAKQLWDDTRSGRPVYNTLTSAEIALGRGRLDEAQRLFREAAAASDAPPSVLWDAHYGLAKVGVASGDHVGAAKEFEATLGIVEHTRAGLLRTDYKLSYLTQLITFYRSYVRELLAQKQFDRALEIADSSRARVLAERQRAVAAGRVDAAALRQIAARQQLVFLSYWLTPQASDLWIVTGKGTRHVELPPSSEIESLLRDHQAAIASVVSDPLGANSPGDKLYRILVGPAARDVHPGSRVVIVPDGVLHGLNFETLPVDGPRRRYWIEDVEIQVAPSLAGVTPSTAAADGPGRVLIIGDAVSRPPEFPRLKFAGAEMQKVAGHFAAQQVARFSDEHATPSAYRAAEPRRFSYVHFAAHATANRDSPLDSAVILSGSGESYKLYARDVAALPLSADLVTVSACRSAGERAYSGEGLVGFAWAFLRAGARRVVAGLWDVDDQTTADLMDGLYAGIAKGERPSFALREAKLALARKGARPFVWGAFQLFTVVP
jgi:CHAT domain-containing protein